KARFDKMTPGQRNTYFEKWARDRAEAGKIDGVLVHICMSPGHYEVYVTEEARKKAFPEADRRKLADLLGNSLKERKFEQGLGDTVRFVKERFQANIPPAVVALPKPALNQVSDHASVFSASAVTKANNAIADLKRQYKKDIVIETSPTVAEGTDFGKLLTQRSAEARGDGIHVLVTKSPGHVQVGASEDTLKKAFPTNDVTELKKILLANIEKN